MVRFGATAHVAAELDDCHSVLIFRKTDKVLFELMGDRFESFLVSIAKSKNVGDGMGNVVNNWTWWK